MLLVDLSLLGPFTLPSLHTSPRQGGHRTWAFSAEAPAREPLHLQNGADSAGLAAAGRLTTSFT